MCATCGCSPLTELVEHEHPHDHEHGLGHTHDHEHGHGHSHGHEPAVRTVTLEEAVLAKNDELAAGNRDWLAERGILALNLMSSPGSGKTTLLVRTIGDLGLDVGVSVIEGDQETPLDADRIKATGAPVVQINTGSGCHLDAPMVARALEQLDPPAGSVVVVENVGNLVCPALFDLGEAQRVVVMSVTEGADKPLKYPHMFRTADLVLLNKVDLLPYVDFDVDACVANARRASPGVEVLALSATRGDGLAGWYTWLRARMG